MRNMLWVACAAMFLPGCASAAEPTPAPVLPGPVTYEVRSWGALLLHWQVNPDGSGEIWRGDRKKGGGEVRKFRMRLSPSVLQTVAANLEDARQTTQDGAACTKDIYDLPYGTITWDYPDSKRSWSFDAGCRSEEADEAMDLLGAASTVVENSAVVDAKPYAIEPGPR